MGHAGGVVLVSFCYVVLRRLLQLAALRVRSNDFKELEIVVLRHELAILRDTQDLLAQRGITVSYEAIRQWCRTFGSAYARNLQRRQGRLGDTGHLDELFVNIQGRTILANLTVPTGGFLATVEESGRL
jgi:transposase-like protein